MPKLLHFHKKNILSGILLLIFIWSLFSVNWGPDLFHTGGWTTLMQMVKGFFNPDLSPEILKLAIISSWRTLAYAVAGMTLAIAIGFIFGILGSGVLAPTGVIRGATMAIFRGILGVMRAIHELVWAWLFVAATGLSPFVAIFAIALSYGGILGRIFADMINDVPEEPIKALQANGASRLQQLCYGYIPLASVDMISYVFYRFECAIRSSAIMSFVGLGGLGFQIDLSLADLKYNEVWTFMFFLIGLVIIVDIWSQLLRKRLVS